MIKPIAFIRRLPGALAILALLALNAHTALADEETHYNRVSLSAESFAEVDNDRMLATLSVEREGKDPARLADEVNRAMRWALDRVHPVDGIDAQTSGYRILAVREKGRIRRWRAVQSLDLRGTDFTALGGLLGELQDRLLVKSITFRVSPERRRQVENGLISEALDAFKERAGVVVAGLKAGGYRTVTLSITTRGGGLRPIPQLRAGMAAPPALEAGASRLTVTVSGVIELQ